MTWRNWKLILLSLAFVVTSGIPAQSFHMESAGLTYPETLDMREAIDVGTEASLGNSMCDRYFVNWDYQTYVSFDDPGGPGFINCRVENDA
ncbi:MAG: hypothetical protein AAF609_18540 [Cyanobacteria bacterium P01_C01_bin.120]